MYALIALVAVIAGLVQGTTGFGLGIVLMMIFPFFMPVSTGAAMVAVSSVIPDAMVAYTHRHALNVRKAVLPSILFAIMCAATITISASVEAIVIKRLLGAFLIAVAIYFLFFSHRVSPKRISLPVAVIFIVVSGICDGLFAIGGPLMVIYYLATTESIEEYLGTINLFFICNLPLSIAFRIANGFIGPQHALLTFICVVGLVIGILLSRKLMGKLDDRLIRRIIYVMIAFAGFINLLG